MTDAYDAALDGYLSWLDGIAALREAHLAALSAMPRFRHPTTPEVEMAIRRASLWTGPRHLNE
jgi:hypothetical protein